MGIIKLFNFGFSTSCTGASKMGSVGMAGNVVGTGDTLLSMGWGSIDVDESCCRKLCCLFISDCPMLSPTVIGIISTWCCLRNSYWWDDWDGVMDIGVG